jgi:glyoxylase-like metal-dependent hydrolase (beta-lactamase superfamily II)
MSYYEVKRIESWLYSFHDPLLSYCYLVVGNEKALLYDTAYGIGDLKGEVRKITDKPITVVLSHGHVDHVNGAYQFDSAHISDKDYSLSISQSTPEYKIGNFKRVKDGGLEVPPSFDHDVYNNSGPGIIWGLRPGDTFDLGGLSAQAVAMEGHTPGSTGLLIKEKRTLLAGDATNEHMWLFLLESLPISGYIKMLERTLKLDFDTFYCGHWNEPHSKQMIPSYMKVAAEASIEKSMPYHMYTPLNPFFYESGGVGIVFNAKKLR